MSRWWRYLENAINSFSGNQTGRESSSFTDSFSIRIPFIFHHFSSFFIRITNPNPAVLAAEGARILQPFGCFASCLAFFEVASTEKRSPGTQWDTEKSAMNIYTINGSHYWISIVGSNHLNWLVVEPPSPLKNMTSSVGIWHSQLNGKKPFQTTSQYNLYTIHSNHIFYDQVVNIRYLPWPTWVSFMAIMRYA